MTKKEIIILKNSITACTNLVGVKFAYAMAKNSALLQPELDALEKASTPTKEFQEYDSKRLELIQKYVAKDKEGKPLEVGGSYVLEDPELWGKVFEEFKKQGDNQKIVDDRQKQSDDYNKLLEENVEITLFKVALEDIPPTITTGQLIGISSLVKE